MRLAALLVVALLASGCGGDDPERDALFAYLVEADQIDEDWRSGVEAAYEGREYLATGDLPTDGRTTATIIRDAEANFTQLIAATRPAIAAARALDPPASARDFHDEWILVLTDLETIWSRGLTKLSARDFEGFVEAHAELQSEFGNMNLRINLLNADRQAFADIIDE